MSQTIRGIQGRLHLRVCSPGGLLLAERTASNVVLRQGAAVVARLFAGAEGARGISHVQVGFGTEAGDPELKALTPPAEAVPLEALRSAIAADAFAVSADRPGSVQVSIAAVFRPTVELKGVSEAGLLAGDTLYNQVVFEPVTLRAGQDITLFWEIEFPFGN